ncbi:hypothetical protein BJ878DRAFT_276672 [Calycina marina]|uniref:Secreted protein n=1 Tax=Calycina marina TaxID=1763456 RepID=A0A9P7YWG4_9HELO|nr:hypothetical protein BJ878DRAFT_276672 [Calycina marina]
MCCLLVSSACIIAGGFMPTYSIEVNYAWGKAFILHFLTEPQYSRAVIGLTVHGPRDPSKCRSLCSALYLSLI